MKTQPVLETNNLIIRLFDFTDATIIQQLAGDKSIADTTLNIPYPYKNGMAEDFIKETHDKYSSNESIECAIVLKNSLQLIGAIGLNNISLRFLNAELGYWIGKPFWNQGFCTEAAREVVRFAFTDLGLHKVYTCHLERNKSSAHVQKKVGFQYEGTFREHLQKWGKPENLVYQGILKSEWVTEQKAATGVCRRR